MTDRDRRDDKAGAQVDPGFEGFRDRLRRSFPGMSDRDIGEAWMRDTVTDMPFGPPETWRHVPGTVTVQLVYKGASISAAVKPADIEGIVEHWSSLMKDEPVEDARAATRNVVVEGLATNRHNDREGANVIVHAGMWLAWTHPNADGFHALLKRGDARLFYDITDIKPGTFNFRLGLEDLLGDAT